MIKNPNKGKLHRGQQTLLNGSPRCPVTYVILIKLTYLVRSIIQLLTSFFLFAKITFNEWLNQYFVNTVPGEQNVKFLTMKFN